MVAEIIRRMSGDIEALCEQHALRSLWFLDSVSDEVIAPRTTGIVFIVDLGDYDDTAITRYLALASGIEELLDSPIVLISNGILNTRHVLRKQIEREWIRVYG